MKHVQSVVVLWAVILLLAVGSSGEAATIVWTNTTGLWNVDGNWSGGVAPGPSDDVVITNAGASVLLTNSATVNSLALSRTLTFTNWDTALYVGTVRIYSNGIVTASGPYAGTNLVMSNRVYILCRDLTVDLGGSIDVNGKGWSGNPNQFGYGPGGGGRSDAESAGGGYGGTGGNNGAGYGGGATYGSSNAPLDPGSAGGSSGMYQGSPGGHGGGAIRIKAANRITLDGTITANGGPPPGGRCGAGSGGSVYLTCLTLAGAASGSLSAKGATSGNASGGGGGGRIAVWRAYDTYAGSNSVAGGPDGVPAPGQGTMVWGKLQDLQVSSSGAFGSGLNVETYVVTNTTKEVLVNLKNMGDYTNALYWTLSTATPWISLGGTNGVIGKGLTNTVSMTNSAVALAVGSYTGQIAIVHSNRTMAGVEPLQSTITVVMHVVNSLPPTIASITSSTADGIYTPGAGINVTVTFSEPVTLSGGTLDVALDVGRTAHIAAFGPSLSASGTYTVLAGDSSPDLDSTGVALSGGTLTNTAGVSAVLALPPTTIAVGSNIRIDPPTTVISTIAVDPTGLLPIPYSVFFSRPVVGFVSGDVIVTNGAVGAFSGSGSNYTFNVTPAGRGLVTVAIPVGAALDAANNASLAATPDTRTFAYALTVTVNPSGAGTVTGSNLWYNLVVTNTAAAGGGYHFVQWSGSGVPAGATTPNPLILTMDQPRTIQANFATNGAVQTRTWSGTNNWFSTTNWSPVGFPDVGDTAIVPSGTVTLADSVTVAAMTVTNATVLFTNWNTRLSVTGTLTVQTNGVVTHAGPFPNGQSNNLYIACANLAVQPGGAINANAKGWAGNANMPGYGPGGGDRGDAESCGGSYGGQGGGGQGTPAQPYGSATNPVLPGSAGGSSAYYQGSPGGHGGGAIRIAATKVIALNGAVTANGGSAGGRCGGGSGGSIYLSCQTFTGSGSGVLSANGTAGGASSGVGGGGRIAIYSAFPGSNTVGFVAVTNVTVGGANVGTIYWGQLPPPPRGSLFYVR